MEKRFHKIKLENLLVIEKIVTIHYFEFDRFFTYEGEKHDFWEMVYADKEDVIVRAESEEFVLRQGEAVFHKPDEFHSLSSNRIAPPNVFIITFECKSAAMQYFEQRRLKLPKELRQYIRSIISEAGRTFVMNKQDPFITGMTVRPDAVPGGQQLIRLNLEHMLILLLRRGSEKENPDVIFISPDSFDDVLVDGIIKKLSERLYENLSVNDLCAQFHFGKTHLYDTFKAKTGVTLKSYYNGMKIAEAKRLIRENRLTLKEIADLLSFASLSYFCKAFKRQTSMTPTQYFRSIIE